MNNLDDVFVDVDEFCQTFLPIWGNTSFLSISSKEISLHASPLPSLLN
ncbi:hypothetical protein [Candidatus Enterovibrio escicola]|nr:hypothetical protein [Candidatus Enterovibrio escacola]